MKFISIEIFNYCIIEKKLEFKITNKNEHKCCFKTVIVIFSKVQCFKILCIFWVMEKGLNSNFKQEFNPSEQVFKKNIIVIFFLIKAQETLLCQCFYSKSNAWLCDYIKRKHNARRHFHLSIISQYESEKNHLPFVNVWIGWDGGWGQLA